ncbi:MAG: LamG domain-containing protein [Planctomycetes bacterium]|nr:LamG domain-containing protein [Planctomycetota bacterium]
MTRLSSTALLAATLTLAPAALVAQDILFYRFDEGGGTKAINYATGSPAPAEGTIVSGLAGAPQSSWAPGRFGTALAAGQGTAALFNRVDTGWVPGTYTGSLSYAMWVRINNPAAPPSLFYVLGAPTGGAFRVFSGTSGLIFTSGIGSSPASVANVVTLARAGWVHVAFVLDTTALTTQYFINGVPETPRTITSAPSWTSNVNFLVGNQLTTSPGSFFDLDEVLLTRRVLSPLEIQLLASTSRAADGIYKAGCGTLALGSAGGPPALGNGGYALTLSSPGPLSYALGIGSNRRDVGGVPLPFDLAPLFPGLGTCLLDTSMDILVLNGAKGPGGTNVPFAIPNLPSLAGTSLFLQVSGVGGATPLELSNGLSIGLGS